LRGKIYARPRKGPTAVVRGAFLFSHERRFLGGRAREEEFFFFRKEGPQKGEAGTKKGILLGWPLERKKGSDPFRGSPGEGRGETSLRG